MNQAGNKQQQQPQKGKIRSNQTEMTCCLDTGLQSGRADLIDDSATEPLPWEKKKLLTPVCQNNTKAKVCSTSIQTYFAYFSHVISLQVEKTCY